MRMLKAISLKRFQGAIGRPLRRFAGKARERVRWGPFVNLGRNVRLQSKVGHRAAVVEIRKGLFLVAEVPEKTLRPEFGVLPLLAPLLVTAARSALKGKKRKPRRPELPGPIAEWADEEDVDAVVESCHD
jgi:hypothetical protein